MRACRVRLECGKAVTSDRDVVGISTEIEEERGKFLPIATRAPLLLMLRIVTKFQDVPSLLVNTTHEGRNS